MNAQTEFVFDIAEPDVKTLNDIVRVLLKDGRWWCPWELCEEIWLTRQIRVSDSTVTARLRDMRKPQFGGHVIQLRKRQGTRAYEYRMEK